MQSLIPDPFIPTDVKEYNMTFKRRVAFPVEAYFEAWAVLQPLRFLRALQYPDDIMDPHLHPKASCLVLICHQSNHLAALHPRETSYSLR